MKLALSMVAITYIYVLARVAGLLVNTGLYFGILMALLTTANLFYERRCK